MPALSAGFEQQLQTVAQRVALDLEAIQGKRRKRTQQQTGEQQTTHNELPYGLREFNRLQATVDVQGECVMSAKSSTTSAPVSCVSSTT
ncbi:hypothetical protein D3C86_2076850 [compost metagenome]